MEMETKWALTRAHKLMSPSKQIAKIQPRKRKINNRLAQQHCLSRLKLKGLRSRKTPTQGWSTSDRFGISLSNGYMLTTRVLAGGNIQLHKPNPSTTPPSTFTECNSIAPDPGP